MIIFKVSVVSLISRHVERTQEHGKANVEALGSDREISALRSTQIALGNKYSQRLFTTVKEDGKHALGF